MKEALVKDLRENRALWDNSISHEGYCNCTEWDSNPHFYHLGESILTTGLTRLSDEINLPMPTNVCGILPVEVSAFQYTHPYRV